MDQQNKRQIQIASALAVILVAVVAYQFLFAGAPSGGAASGAAGTPAKPAGAAPAVPTANQSGSPANAPKLLEQPEVDLDQLLSSLDLAPMDYRKVQIARNPFQPLVGSGKVNTTTHEGESEGEGPVGIKSQGGTEPPVNPKEAKIKWAQNRIVTGIMWDPRSPVAIVNDEVVSMGYTYPNEVVVQAIGPTEVVFRIDDRSVTVKMKEK